LFYILYLVDISHILWVNFFCWEDGLYTSIIMRYLNELSLILYIPFYFILRKKNSIYIINTYTLLLFVNIFYVFVNLYFYQLFYIDCAGNLLYSKYILFSKIVVLIAGLLTILTIKDKLLKADDLLSNEFLLLFNILLLYLCIFVSSFDFIVVLISMEGISFILYGLGGFLILNLIALESIIKYFILSSISGAFSILGISFVFSLFGSLNFLEIQTQLNSNIESFFIANVHLIIFLTFFGFFFKLAFFPFH